MRRRDFCLVLLAIGWSGTARAQEGAPVGYLLHLKGDVRVVRASQPVPVAAGYRLRVGDRVNIPRGGAGEAVHSVSGKHYALPPGAAIAVRAEGLWLTAARGARPVEPPVLRRYPVALTAGMPSPRAGKILGVRARGAEGDALREPAPIGAVREAPGGGVTLRWKNEIAPSAGATLQLEVRRDGERDPFLVEELPLAATGFRLPEGTLAPGALHWWKVSVAAPGIGLLQAGGSLWLLTDAERDAAAAAERAAAEARRAQPDSGLPDRLLGERLRDLGLFAEALAALRRAARLDPSSQADLAETTRELRQLLGETSP